MSNDQVTYLLKEILTTLKAMKEQEREYWETWRQAKSKEVRKREE